VAFSVPAMLSIAGLSLTKRTFQEFRREHALNGGFLDQDRYPGAETSMKCSPGASPPMWMELLRMPSLVLGIVRVDVDIKVSGSI